MENLTKYDANVQAKINAAKSQNMEYRVVVQGEEPDSKNSKNSKNWKRLNIVITKDGKFVKTYYG